LAISWWLTKWAGADKKTQLQDSTYPLYMAYLIIAIMVLMIFRAMIIFMIILKSSSGLHKSMTMSVLRADIKFFDSNPIGRVITRFAKDVVVLDLIMPQMALFVTWSVFRIASVLIVISVVNPWLILVTFFLFLCVYFMMK